MANSLFEKEASLTSHKAAKMTTRFATSGDIDLRKSPPGNWMLGKRISSGYVGMGWKKNVCVDGEVEVRGDGNEAAGEKNGNETRWRQRDGSRGGDET